MNQEDYTSFRAGKFTRTRAMHSMITVVASSLYSYMVMLNLAGRASESQFYEGVRCRIFGVRDRIRDDVSQSLLDELSADMRCIHKELETARTFLTAHKPDEVCILQTAVNDACGLIYTIKHFRDVE